MKRGDQKKKTDKSKQRIMTKSQKKEKLKGVGEKFDKAVLLLPFLSQFLFKFVTKII